MFVHFISFNILYNIYLRPIQQHNGREQCFIK